MVSFFADTFVPPILAQHITVRESDGGVQPLVTVAVLRWSSCPNREPKFRLETDSVTGWTSPGPAHYRVSNNLLLFADG